MSSENAATFSSHTSGNICDQEYVLYKFQAVLVVILKCSKLSLSNFILYCKLAECREIFRNKSKIVLFCYVFFTCGLGRKNAESRCAACSGETDTVNREESQKTNWREICSQLHQLSLFHVHVFKIHQVLLIRAPLHPEEQHHHQSTFS